MATLEIRHLGEPVSSVEIPPGTEILLGRDPRCEVMVPREPCLSRLHATLKLGPAGLAVQRLPGTTNPVCFGGEACDQFDLLPGQHFVVGSTEFRLLNSATGEPTPSALPVREERLRLRDLLELPEVLRLKSQPEFQYHLATLLRLTCMGDMGGVARTDGTWLALDSPNESDAQPQRADAALIKSALEAPGEGVFRAGGSSFWVGAALQLPGEEPTILAVYGRRAGRTEAWLEESARYAGLVAHMVSRSLSLGKLEAWQERLNRYFSAPVVENILRSKDPKDLEPRLAEATVMFFDLRGFSRRTEDRNEKILEYLGELRRVMTAMTAEVFRESGVVLQYQGDGILACWNLPLPDPAHVDRACRAALAMVRRLSELPGGWTCGVGLHGGEVVAGAIGSEQLFNYSILGAVVNQSSRVEGITKAVEVPVLVTSAIASRVAEEVAVPVRVGRFRPLGMAQALDLYALQEPPGESARNAIFSQGLEAFERGDWDLAYERLSQLGAGDRPARFLVALSEDYRRHPPRDWDGVIEMKGK